MGVRSAVVFEDPGVDPHVHADDPLLALALNLDRTFIPGIDGDSDAYSRL